MSQNHGAERFVCRVRFEKRPDLGRLTKRPCKRQRFSREIFAILRQSQTTASQFAGIALSEPMPPVTEWLPSTDIWQLTKKLHEPKMLCLLEILRAWKSGIDSLSAVQEMSHVPKEQI